MAMTQPTGPNDAPTVDVAVVGGGPVGAVLALLLADRGRRVVVIERWRSPYPLPRAVHFDDETARILQACGLGPVLPVLSEPADVYEWRNGEGVALLRLGTSGVGRCGWPAANMFNQPDLEAELNVRLDEHPLIEIRRGHEVLDLLQGAEEVELALRPTPEQRVATREPGEVASSTSRLRARFTVGCDGANSTVRHILDPPIEDHGFFYDWLIVDVAVHTPRVFDPPNLQVCDPDRPTTVVSGGPGRRRWEFMCLPGESLDALDEEARAWELLEPWDIGPDNATMIRHAGYRFQARWATRWHAGRVFLAGDAAHQTPPFAGQGMGEGLRDAANLAWKLDHVLEHPEVSDLLDTYDLERIPHAAAVIGLAMELGKITCVPDAEAATARDAAMAPLVVEGESTPVPPMPPLSDGLLALGSSCAGEVFVQGRVRVDGVTGLFDDLFGVGWRLVATPEVPTTVPTDLATWFSSIGGRTVIIGPGGDVDDVDGTYGEWFADRSVSAGLQRPDFALFGTTSNAGGIATLISELQQRLTGSPLRPGAFYD
jgi:2-polyprenyl-6-methoxyphenol hydroxylase-like FAD-dependent oxidoreductase